MDVIFWNKDIELNNIIKNCMSKLSTVKAYLILELNEMRMLRWMCRVTKKDKIRNEHARGSVKVAPVTKKIIEKGG